MEEDEYIDGYEYFDDSEEDDSWYFGNASGMVGDE